MSSNGTSNYNVYTTFGLGLATGITLGISAAAAYIQYYAAPSTTTETSTLLVDTGAGRTKSAAGSKQLTRPSSPYSPSSLPPSLLDRLRASRAVLFDLDGTLVESAHIWYLLLQAAAAHFGHDPVDHSAWAATFGQSMEQNVALFLRGTSQAEFNQFCDDHYADFLDHLSVLDGSIDTVAECAKRWNGQICIVTNCPRKITLLILAHTKLDKHFTHVICAGDIIIKHSTANDSRSRDADTAPVYPLQPKPSTDMLLYAADTLNVSPSDCIFVGDSKFDMIAANDADCISIGIGSKLGLVVCQSIAEFGSIMQQL